MHGNHKGAPTKQPKAQKHAQPANMCQRSKQKGGEMLKVRLPSNQMRKNRSNQQMCGKQGSKTVGQH